MPTFYRESNANRETLPSAARSRGVDRLDALSLVCPRARFQEMSELVPIVITAFALALDAFAVAVAAGLARGRVSARDSLRVSLCFGGFQAGMPLVGALLGSSMRPFVETYAPLLAGFVLIGLGAYALRAAFSAADEARDVDFFDTRVLLSLGFATSIDAFAAGVSMALSGSPIALGVSVIGGITAGLCFGGVLLADRVERLLGSRTEIAGALALMALGATEVVGAIRA